MRLYSIRIRLTLLVLILLFFPVLIYRLALDFNRQLLEQQMVQQAQTVQNLSLILANRPDLWSLQIFQGDPTHQLRHLDLEQSALWIVNAQGVTTYVIGHLPMHDEEINYDGDPFVWLGKLVIRTIHKLFPTALPYLAPMDQHPEQSLIKQVLGGALAQRFRFDDTGKLVSLMSATPIVIKNQQVGAIVLEQRAESLFGPRLRNFYHIVGMGTVVLALLILAFTIYAYVLSQRIIRLQQAVSQAYDIQQQKLNTFQDAPPPSHEWDEVDQLRHQIFLLLQALQAYTRYLRQLPKTLRHELHNPLNRVSLSLQRLEATKDLETYVPQIEHGLKQLTLLLQRLSETASLEESLSQLPKETFSITEMLNAYAQAVQTQLGTQKFHVHIALPEDTMICGDGFLIEQALDKLIDNARDFATTWPIQLKGYLDKSHHNVIIEVINQGTLPKHVRTPMQLFEGMTSYREKLSQHEQAPPHLGLGLYIVRLISQFHQGEARIFQREKEVVVQLSLPAAPCTDN